MEENEGFHLEQGLFFKRLENGKVRIRKYKTAHSKETEIIFEQVIDAFGWASIIGSVSNKGEGDGRFDIALQFHNE